jgi:hypothetical protein
MSTKIYNGYKLPRMDLDELYSFFMEIGKELRIISRELYTEALSRIAVGIVDSLALDRFNVAYWEKYMYSDMSHIYPVSVAEFCLGKTIERAKKEKDPLFDWGFSVDFIPREDKILCLLFAEKKEFIEYWQNIKEVEEYPYWDNSDEPEGMDYEDWKLRGKEWEDAMKDEFIPSFNSLSFSPSTDRIHFVSSKELADKQPSTDVRLDRWTRTILDEEYHSKCKSSSEEDFSGKKDLLKFAEANKSYEDWSRTEEFKERYDVVIAEVAEKLKETLDHKDLAGMRKLGDKYVK